MTIRVQLINKIINNLLKLIMKIHNINSINLTKIIKVLIIITILILLCLLNNFNYSFKIHYHQDLLFHLLQQ